MNVDWAANLTSAASAPFETSQVEAALSLLFTARSVALVGMSVNPDHLSNATLRNLVTNGFKGEIRLVNPRHDAIAGRPCYPSVLALPDAVDVAVVMVAAPFVADVVRQCGERGIVIAIVLTSGFEEARDGSAAARDLANAVRDTGVVVIGPNCEGIWSVSEKLVLSFGSAARRETLYHAPIGIISQSGAVGGAIVRHLQDSECGCAYMVSVGNEVSIDCLDMLAWMIERDDVRVVAMFVEAFQHGDRLLRIAERARQRNIRIVVLKSGNSDAGRQATQSHTGKVASQFRVYCDLLRQAGITQVKTLGELVDAARILGRYPARLAVNTGVAILSIPGGTRALTVDLCEDYGIRVAQYSEITETLLSKMLPPYAHAPNPTDLTGAVLSDPDLFEAALEVVLQDPDTGSAIVQLANRGPSDLVRYGAKLISHSKRTGIPIVVSLLADAIQVAQLVEWEREGLIVAREPADAVRYLSWLRPPIADDRPTPMHALPPAPSDETWSAATAFCREAGMPVVKTVRLESNGLTDSISSQLRGPFVVKALPEQIAHKSELGLVRLNVETGAVPAVAAELRAILGEVDAPIHVQEMVEGIEAVVSFFNDPDFGPVMMIGVGGTEVELWSDVKFLALPATATEIAGAITSTRLGVLIAGYRGSPAGDLRSLIDAVTTLSNAFWSHRTRIDTLEFNPVIVTPTGPVAVDALLTLNGVR